MLISVFFQTLTSHEDIDVFGQPVFNPMPTGCAPNKLVHDRTGCFVSMAVVVFSSHQFEV